MGVWIHQRKLDGRLKCCLLRTCSDNPASERTALVSASHCRVEPSWRFLTYTVCLYVFKKKNIYVYMAQVSNALARGSFKNRTQMKLKVEVEPPFSVGHVAFLFICLPGVSCWCPPFSVGHASVSQVCHCWCPPFSAGDATFLFICFPGLSLLVSTLFRWPCSFLYWCCRPFPLAT